MYRNMCSVYVYIYIIYMYTYTETLPIFIAFASSVMTPVVGDILTQRGGFAYG